VKMPIFISISLVFLTAFGQILLKMGANNKTGHQFLNRFVISGYLTFLLTVLLSYYVMKFIPMKYFTVIMSASYVVVMVGSRVFLNEAIKRDRIFGTMLITTGILIFMIR